jgi:phage shock protein A
MDRAEKWLRRTYYRWQFGPQEGQALFDLDLRMKESEVPNSSQPIDLSDPKQVEAQDRRNAQAEFISFRERVVQQITQKNRLQGIEEDLLTRLKHLDSELNASDGGNGAVLQVAIVEVHAQLAQVAVQKEQAIADVDRMKEQVREMERAYRDRFEKREQVDMTEPKH